jgi:hypothetical protein
MKGVLAYGVAFLSVSIGALALLGILPIFPAPPQAPGCPWWNFVCTFQSGVQNAYNTALYAVVRLVVALGVGIGAFILLAVKIGSFGPRALTALGLVLIALALAVR